MCNKQLQIGHPLDEGGGLLEALGSKFKAFGLGADCVGSSDVSMFILGFLPCWLGDGRGVGIVNQAES